MVDGYQLYIIDRHPIALLSPTNEEDGVINELCNEPDFVYRIQEHIAGQLVALTGDLDRIWHITADIFEFIDKEVEDYLSEMIDDYPRWNLMSPQPHILARAFKSNAALRNAVAIGVGCPNGEIRAASDIPYEGNDIHEFLYLSLVKEINSRIYSEKLISADDLKEIKSRDDFLSSIYSYIDIASHTFIALSNSAYNENRYDETVFCAVRVIEGNVNKFVDHHKLYGASDFNDSYSNYEYVVNREVMINDLRWSQLESNHQEFKNSWNKTEYLDIIGIKLLNLADTNEYEQKILEYIRRLAEEPTEYADGEQLQDSAGAAASGTVAERLARLDQFVAANPREPVSQLVLELFPAILNEVEQRLPLPTIAPEIWPDDRKEENGSPETPPAFIKRVYGEWEGRGLTKKLVRALDPTLYRALYNWLQRGNAMPADLDLPTIAEQNDRVIDDLLRQGGIEDTSSFAAKEIVRVQSALRRRIQPE